MTNRVVFKVLESLALACLVDRERVDYGEKVITYWPDFGQQGKDLVRIEDVLRHEAGLPFLDHAFTAKELQSTNVKHNNSVGEVIERQQQKFPPKSKGTTRDYHMLTRYKLVVKF